MDAYEATKIVFSRIQSVDPENASKIMGLLLIQDHGEEDMIRMAFGPESLLESVVLKARNELSLLSGPPSPPLLSSATFATPRSSTPASWSPVFSNRNASECSDDHLLVPSEASDIDFSMQEPQQQNALPPGNDSNLLHGAAIDSNGGEGDRPFYPEMTYPEFPSPPPPLNGDVLSWGGPNNGLCSPPAFGWKQCLYYARGYCKKGSACRFLHCSPEDASTAAAASADVVIGAEQQLDEQLPRRRRAPSQRLSNSQLMSCAASSLMPWSSPPPSKCVGLLLQQQQQLQLEENQRAAMMMLSADQQLKYLNRARMERGDYLGMVNPGSRQIYLTFPADSTFREEDVSNYFSIYGPVQDVRIPHQQKRMFGFVTFIYPETVKLILAKGNPHFVCNSRVLVKPYKEKGKIFDKKLLQQQLLMERCDFSGCWSQETGGFDCRDTYDLQQFGPRMLLNSKQLLLRRKVEEQQQAAMDLQNAIEFQRRQFTVLQLHDPKSHCVATTTPVSLSDNATVSTSISLSSPEEHVLEGKNSSGTTVASVIPSKLGWDLDVSEDPNTEEVQQDLAACDGKPNEDDCYQERFAKSVSITEF